MTALVRIAKEKQVPSGLWDWPGDLSSDLRASGEGFLDNMPEAAGGVVLDAEDRDLEAGAFARDGDEGAAIAGLEGRVAEGHLPKDAAGEALLLAKVIDNCVEVAAHERTARASASISRRLPKQKGVRWWMPSGRRSRMRLMPVVARPPACSARKARGLAS